MSRARVEKRAFIKRGVYGEFHAFRHVPYFPGTRLEYFLDVEDRRLFLGLRRDVDRRSSLLRGGGGKMAKIYYVYDIPVYEYKLSREINFN